VWQLSSLARQRGAPEFVVNVAYVKNTGNPRTEDIIAHYKDRIQFNEIVFDSKDDVLYRGKVRNGQVMRSKCDWLYFADCDLVYSKWHLAQLSQSLKGEKVVSSKNVWCTDYDTQGLIDNQRCLQVKNVYRKACGMVKNKKTVPFAYGGMQVVNRNVLVGKRGYYVKKCRDQGLDNIRTPSDVAFRNALGFRMISIDPVVHLQHYRFTDKKFDKDMQR